VSGEVLPAIGDFPPGAQIASYRIDQLIGRGGMATVYRATDIRLDRVVALKVLIPELAGNSSFRQRFMLESRAGASLDHPHVIPVFEAGEAGSGAGEAGSVLFIAMRFVAGLDVRALIDREGRLSAARTVSIVSQVASALDAAHQHGLVHRDVKPANMLLSEVSDGNTADYVYLSDFGLSKQSVSSASLTGTGQFLGTLDYMSPEQISGKQLDGRTDLYALGCAAFEMLTGQPPFRREANLAVMWAQVSAEPPSVRQWRPELSAAVDTVIWKALAKAPEQRQATCAEFASALAKACAEGSVGTQAAVITAGSPTPRVGPPTELVAGAAAGPAGAGLAGGLAGGLAAAGVGEATVSRLPSGGGQATPPPAAGTPPPAAGAPPPAAGAPPPAAGAPPAGPGYNPGLATTGPVPVAPSGPGWPGQGGPVSPPQGYQQYGGAYGPPPAGPGYGYGYAPGASGPGYVPGVSGPGYGPGPSGFGYAPPGPPPQRNKAIPILIGVLIVVILAGAAFTVLHLRNSGNTQAGPQTTKTITAQPSTGQSSTPAASPTVTVTATATPNTGSISATLGPAAAVKAYYQAINSGDYSRAWAINTYAHSLSDYSSYRQGFSGTQNVVLTIDSVSGDEVSVSFIAYQTDNTQKDYSGTYTVENGKIVDAYINQTN